MKGLAAIILLCLLFTSCTKTSTPSTGITGTYVGDEGLANPPIVGSNDTVTISAGSGTNAIIISDASDGVKLNATISHDSITIPNQIFSTGSVIDTFYGSGLVRSDSLYLDMYENSNTSPYNFIINFGGENGDAINGCIVKWLHS